MKCPDCGQDVIVANIKPLPGQGDRQPAFLRREPVYVIRVDQRHPETLPEPTRQNPALRVTGQVVTAYIPHVCEAAAKPKAPKTQLVYKGKG